MSCHDLPQVLVQVHWEEQTTRLRSQHRLPGRMMGKKPHLRTVDKETPRSPIEICESDQQLPPGTELEPVILRGAVSAA